jgi:hypothetical protein
MRRPRVRCPRESLTVATKFSMGYARGYAT